MVRVEFTRLFRRKLFQSSDRKLREESNFGMAKLKDLTVSLSLIVDWSLNSKSLRSTYSCVIKIIRKALFLDRNIYSCYFLKNNFEILPFLIWFFCKTCGTFHYSNKYHNLYVLLETWAKLFGSLREGRFSEVFLFRMRFVWLEPWLVPLSWVISVDTVARLKIHWVIKMQI